MQAMKLNFGSNNIASKPVKEVDKVTLTARRSLDQEMETWRQNSRWIGETPALEVRVPKEAFCEVNSQFKIGLPPDAVWNTLIDPGKQRVFKNIQEVIYCKVL